MHQQKKEMLCSSSGHQRHDDATALSMSTSSLSQYPVASHPCHDGWGHTDWGINKATPAMYLSNCDTACSNIRFSIIIIIIIIINYYDSVSVLEAVRFKANFQYLHTTRMAMAVEMLAMNIRPDDATKRHCIAHPTPVRLRKGLFLRPNHIWNNLSNALPLLFGTARYQVDTTKETFRWRF